MVFFSPQKLENQIANESLTPWEKAKYLFLAAVLAALAGPAYWLSPVIKPINFGTVQSIQHISGIVGLFVAYMGIKKCYLTNDKKDLFIERFVCLRVPWTVLFTLVLTPTSLILIFLLKHILPENHDIPFLVISISAPFVIFIYYHCMSGSFRRLNNSNN